MNPSDPTARTQELLHRLRGGDAGVTDELFRRLYEQLRDVARDQLARERIDHTLQPTALVHEVWVRIAGADPMRADSRQHFLRIAGRAMRHVLVDHARKRSAQKRQAEVESLDRVLVAWEKDETIDPVVLNELVERLQKRDERLAQVVELRFFAGLTIAETAAALGLTDRQVQVAWRLARAFLLREFERRE